ncbi:hypothetical protein Pst134EA_024716 [Puccinia striiformis f. sp. tritici]|uniref:Uncharacterized protein n=2 Tax=Puccinia striiformis TaxID=27350 RepID=A0A0L0VM88_9BASI|nr:hypothetical protein Pst134EA_024716 [Puccinia striiformis f. sp. tritici]KAI9625362.1 hypothetical protein H4Q26_016386 [Puccinia striiformis f. sp. tritici PST-130]KNF00371.1 hypothetical protein PSTG_06301 [Puccinia striiformis f. sp. tritici PST-78]POV96807.1 hypothetical protein PSHT_14940 [Puccinia striiformis]KAH9445125.1 hypothetical protein Pst134EB_025374 [Puccinia striiformis f. sp. tritici]KAH9453850.1 hypothetical protein Pst134EA_024716 [Puccinia striiformis f. sp. tritici]
MAPGGIWNILRTIQPAQPRYTHPGDSETLIPSSKTHQHFSTSVLPLQLAARPDDSSRISASLVLPSGRDSRLGKKPLGNAVADRCGLEALRSTGSNLSLAGSTGDCSP